MKFAIMGAGVMGRGWITQCAMTGNDVHCFDGNPDTLAGAKAFCGKLASKAAKRAKNNDPEFAQKAMERIHIHSSKKDFIYAARDSDVFFEIIFENMELKCGVLREIAPQLSEKTYFWSNTSSLDIDVLAAASGRPSRSIVCHGMNPVPFMPGVEIVPGTQTSNETIEFTRNVMLEMKKSPFLAPNIPGFWVNRLLIPQMLDAVRLLECGQIAVADGDIGLSTCLGHPQGTFKLADFVSTPTMLRVALEMYQATCDPRLYPPMLLVQMVKNGEFGSVTKKGFYDWSDPKNPKPRSFDGYLIKNVDDLTNLLR